MSHALIDRSPDLKELCSKGFKLAVIDDALLVVKQVPYVASSRQIQRAELIMVLSLNDDRTTKPEDHVVYWSGDPPCTNQGLGLDDVLGIAGPVALGPFPITYMFSAKADYATYKDKVATYVEILEREARQICPGVSARNPPRG